MTKITTLCDPNQPHTCPEITTDTTRPENKRLSITDDFGGKVEMSIGQFSVLIEQSKRGQLDIVCA